MLALTAATKHSISLETFLDFFVIADLQKFVIQDITPSKALCEVSISQPLQISIALFNE